MEYLVFYGSVHSRYDSPALYPRSVTHLIPLDKFISILFPKEYNGKKVSKLLTSLTLGNEINDINYLRIMGSNFDAHRILAENLDDQWDNFHYLSSNRGKYQRSTIKIVQTAFGEKESKQCTKTHHLWLINELKY